MGLEELHAKNVAMLDVKPSNVLLKHASSSGPLKAVLADFGISRVIDNSSSYAPTNPFRLHGTVWYM